MKTSEETVRNFIKILSDLM